MLNKDIGDRATAARATDNPMTVASADVPKVPVREGARPRRGFRWEKGTIAQALDLLEDAMHYRIVSQVFDFGGHGGGGRTGPQKERDNRILAQLEEHFRKVQTSSRAMGGRQLVQALDSLRVDAPNSAARDMLENAIRKTKQAFASAAAAIQREGRVLLGTVIGELRPLVLNAAERGEKGDARAIVEVFYYIASAWGELSREGVSQQRWYLEELVPFAEITGSGKGVPTGAAEVDGMLHWIGRRQSLFVGR